jgi:hypothetical protein
MAPTNRVTSILPEPNADGDNVIGITLGDGSTFDVTIDSTAAQTLVEILQRRLHDDVISRYGPQSQSRSEYEVISTGPKYRILCFVPSDGV